VHLAATSTAVVVLVALNLRDVCHIAFAKKHTMLNYPLEYFQQAAQ
jgi:hypothetical protein